MNPYVFVVGCPRSGTTLLRRMIDAHPEIAMMHETHWIPKLIRDGAVGPDRRVGEDALEALFAHRKFRKLKMTEDEVRRVAGEHPSYADFVAVLFDRFGEAAGKPLVAEKTPGYVRQIPLLHELFPHVRFLHLVRDGRDVCLSALGWEGRREEFEQRFPTWAEQPLTTCALWWRWLVLLGRRSGQNLSTGLYHEVRYEELVSNPEAELRGLCDFLEVDYSESMVRYHEGRTKSEPGLSAKRAWLPPTTGLRAWRTQMTDDEVAEFEAAAGDALDEFGYERTVPTPPRRWIAAAAAAAAAVPGRPLPEGW